MTEIAVTHAWLQKHPTPAARDGEFHWYPEDEGERSLRGWVVEQIAGQSAPAIWWDLGPGRLVWAASFSASADDRRPYRGIVLSVARGHASAAALWRALAPPAAAPYGQPADAPQRGPSASCASDARALARGLLRGGAHELAAAVTPARLAALEELLGEAAPAARRGVWRPHAGAGAASGEPSDALAELLARAAANDAGAATARMAWLVTCELARATGRTCDEVLSGAADPAVPAPLAAAWRARGDGSWLRLLHGWGRGELAAADEGALASPLAVELARRALAELVAGRAAFPVLAAARWQALLPRAHRGALWRALADAAPTLAGLGGAAPRGPRPHPADLEDPTHAA